MIVSGLSIKQKSDLNDFFQQLKESNTYQGEGFLLRWFLENFYNVENPDEYICDGKNDYGIDSIIVDDVDSTITFIQAKERESLGTDEGESGLVLLKERLQSISQGKFVNNISTSDANNKLKELIQTHDVVEKFNSGYNIRGVFITLGQFTPRALRVIEESDNIQGIDAVEISKDILQLSENKSVGVSKAILTFSEAPSILLNDSGNNSIILGYVNASTLASLPGIDSEDKEDIFSINVRNPIKSAINNKVLETLKDEHEHNDFASYNNGLTFIVRSAYSQDKKDMIWEISDFSLCNGGQTLNSLYTYKSFLLNQKNDQSEEEKLAPLKNIRVVVKVVIDRNLNKFDTTFTQLADKVTQRSNAQNKITKIDLFSNDPLQNKLSNDLRNYKIHYSFKRGIADKKKLRGQGVERFTKSTEVAKMVRAFYLGKVHDNHTVSILFEKEEIYKEIFNNRTAEEIVLALDIYLQIKEVLLEKFEDNDKGYLLAKQDLTILCLMHVISEVLRFHESPLLAKPKDYIDSYSKEDMLKLITDICHSFKLHFVEPYSAGQIDMKNRILEPEVPQEIDKYLFKKEDAVIGTSKALRYYYTRDGKNKNIIGLN